MTPAVRPAIEIEDPLSYLPHRPIIEARRDAVIYEDSDPASGLYLLLRGRIALIRRTLTGTEVVLDVLGQDQLFGLGGLIYLDRHAEKAIALEPCSVMFWATGDVLQQIEREPRLGLALMQATVARMNDDLSRIAALSGQTTPERLAHTLLLFATRFGKTAYDGSTELPHLTHKLLSDCIGTSREVVTAQMNRLRRNGYLTYSRRNTRLNIELVKEALRSGLLRESHVA
jgi:CRP-like cAMP-binding protein